ncbi:MAG: SpoIIE family protein phosphatase, partial [Nitrospirota bacterium]
SQALWRRSLFPYIRSHTDQVIGTYEWLKGNKRKAIEIWEKAVAHLRNHTKDAYRLASILLEEASFLLEDKPKDKKAQEYLIEAKEIFAQLGAKLDFDRANGLLRTISSETEAIETRRELTVARHLGSLLSVIKAIGSIFVLDELLEKIVEQAMKVTGAERGFMLLYDEKDHTLKQKVAKGTGEGFSGQPFSYENYKLSLNMIQEAERTGEGIFAGEESTANPHISGELKGYRVREAMCIPLRAKERPLGMIYLDNRMTGGTFGEDELELMKSFALQASVSIENSYLVSNMVEQERLKQEMELGRQIQLSLLPQNAPVLKGYVIDGLMSPAQEIGGDYYDFIPISDNGAGNKWGVVIADVTGKGVDAGIVMGITKSLIHSLSEQDLTTREMVLKLNRHLCNLLNRKKFVSLIYAECNEGDNVFRWSGAGHEYILVLKDSGAPRVEEIMAGGTVLGVFDLKEEDIAEKSISLNRGDKVILYTDGVTEARNAEGSLFTRERFVEILRQSPPLSAQDLLGHIHEKVQGFIGDVPQYDDITLVILEKQ